MAKETTNQGYIDAQAYATDPDNVSTPDSLHQEYERGITSYSLSQDGDSAKLNSLLTTDTVNNRVGLNKATPTDTFHVSTDNVDEGITIQFEGTTGLEGPTLRLAALNNGLGKINYAKIKAAVLDSTNTTEDGRLEFYTIGNGSETLKGYIDEAGELVLTLSGAKLKGSLGVGTTDAPQNRIDADVTADGDGIKLHYAGSVGTQGPRLILTADNNGASETTMAAVKAAILDGTVASEDGRLELYTMGNGTLTKKVEIDEAGNMYTGLDNSQTLGSATYRWSEVFAGNGTINTSDSREKTLQADDSKVLDAIDTINIKAFKWNDSIASKGEANARIHYGVMAQEVKSAFEAQGLVAEDYGVLCYDEWDDVIETRTTKEAVAEVKDSEGNIITPAEPAEYEDVLVKAAGNRYGVRYDELYALKVAALERKIAALTP